MIVETGPVGNKKNIEFVLPEKSKKIAVLVSGGADSAILLYALAKKVKDEGLDKELIPFTVPKVDGAMLYVPGIISWINNKLGVSIPETTQVGDPSLHHSEQVNSGLVDLRSNHGVYHVFYGSNAHPEDPMPGIYPGRPADVKGIAESHPFALVDKRYIIDLYRVFDVMELITLTHSCTERTDSRCGQCFQCAERAWAFDKLGITDLCTH